MMWGGPVIFGKPPLLSREIISSLERWLRSMQTGSGIQEANPEMSRQWYEGVGTPWEHDVSWSSSRVALAFLWEFPHSKRKSTLSRVEFVESPMVFKIKKSPWVGWSPSSWDVWRCSICIFDYLTGIVRKISLSGRKIETDLSGLNSKGIKTES